MFSRKSSIRSAEYLDFGTKDVGISSGIAYSKILSTSSQSEGSIINDDLFSDNAQEDELLENSSNSFNTENDLEKQSDCPSACSDIIDEFSSEILPEDDQSESSYKEKNFEKQNDSSSIASNSIQCLKNNGTEYDLEKRSDCPSACSDIIDEFSSENLPEVEQSESSYTENNDNNSTSRRDDWSSRSSLSQQDGSSRYMSLSRTPSRINVLSGKTQGKTHKESSYTSESYHTKSYSMKGFSPKKVHENNNLSMMGSVFSRSFPVLRTLEVTTNDKTDNNYSKSKLSRGISARRFLLKDEDYFGTQNSSSSRHKSIIRTLSGYSLERNEVISGEKSFHQRNDFSSNGNRKLWNDNDSYFSSLNDSCSSKNNVARGEINTFSAKKNLFSNNSDENFRKSNNQFTSSDYNKLRNSTGKNGKTNFRKLESKSTYKEKSSYSEQFLEASFGFDSKDAFLNNSEFKVNNDETASANNIDDSDDGGRYSDDNDSNFSAFSKNSMQDNSDQFREQDYGLNRSGNTLDDLNDSSNTLVTSIDPIDGVDDSISMNDDLDMNYAGTSSSIECQKNSTFEVFKISSSCDSVKVDVITDLAENATLKSLPETDTTFKEKKLEDYQKWIRKLMSIQSVRNSVSQEHPDLLVELVDLLLN